MGDRFVARYSPGRLILLLLGAVAFVVLGAWVAGLLGPAPRPGREWVGWASMLFFGLCGLVVAPRFFDDEDQIVIDRNGVLWRQWSVATIPWGAVRGWQVREVRNQRFVCLFLKDASQFPRARAGGLLAGLNRGLGFGDVALTAAGTDRKFDELLAAVERWAPMQASGR